MVRAVTGVEPPVGGGPATAWCTLCAYPTRVAAEVAASALRGAEIPVRVRTADGAGLPAGPRPHTTLLRVPADRAVEAGVLLRAGRGDDVVIDLDGPDALADLLAAPSRRVVRAAVRVVLAAVLVALLVGQVVDLLG